MWSLEDCQKERALEIQRRRELVAAKKANALKALERAAERQKALAAALASAQEQAAAHAASQLTALLAPAAAAQAPTAQQTSPAVLGQRQSNGIAGQQEEAAIASATVPINLDSGGDRRKRWETFAIGATFKFSDIRLDSHFDTVFQAEE